MHRIDTSSLQLKRIIPRGASNDGAFLPRRQSDRQVLLGQRANCARSTTLREPSVQLKARLPPQRTQHHLNLDDERTSKRLILRARGLNNWRCRRVCRWTLRYSNRSPLPGLPQERPEPFGRMDRSAYEPPSRAERSCRHGGDDPTRLTPYDFVADCRSG